PFTVALLKAAQMAKTNGDALRLIRSGNVFVNDVQITNEKQFHRYEDLLAGLNAYKVKSSRKSVALVKIID
ncbi:MAG: hypothetical protein WEA77_12705, partial [Hyphomonas sp.]